MMMKTDTLNEKLKKIYYLEKVFKSANNYINKSLRVKIDEDPLALENEDSLYSNTFNLAVKKYNSIIKHVVNYIFIKRYKFDKVHVINMCDTNHFSLSYIHDFNYRSHLKKSTWGQIIKSSFRRDLLVKLVKDDNIYIVATNNKFKDIEIIEEKDLLEKFNKIIRDYKREQYLEKMTNFTNEYYTEQINKLVDNINAEQHVIHDIKTDFSPFNSELSTKFIVAENRNNFVELKFVLNFDDILYDEFKTKTAESLSQTHVTLNDTVSPGGHTNSMQKFYLDDWENYGIVKNNQAFVINKINENKHIIYNIFDTFLKTFDEFFKKEFAKTEDLIKQCMNDKNISFDDIFAILKFKEQTNHSFENIYKSF